MVFSKSKKPFSVQVELIPRNKKNIFLNSFKHICVYAFNKKHILNVLRMKKKKLNLNLLKTSKLIDF